MDSSHNVEEYSIPYYNTTTQLRRKLVTPKEDDDIVEDRIV